MEQTPWFPMAANHTTHESLAESPLNSAVSQSDLLVELDENLRKLMIMFREIAQPNECQHSFVEPGTFLDSDFSGELTAAFSNPDTVSGLSACDELTADSHFLSQNIVDPMHFSATLDSYSSINAVESPVSVNIIEGSDNQAKGATSGSLCDQSDVDDKAAATHKRLRRRISNKESARISRTRKREQLIGLERQAEKLMTENATLFKQFWDSWLQFCNADTNNLILKSNVEALRAKVKLAEGMISRIHNELVQNQSQLNTATQLNNINSVGLVAHVSPTNAGHENDASYAAMAQNSSDPGSIWKQRYFYQ